MMFFLLGLVVLVLGLFLLNWFANASPKDVLRSLKWIAIGVIVAIILLVVVTRNINLIWGIFAGAIPLLMRLQSIRQLWKSMRGPSKGQASEISSGFFDMKLDHDSGEMDGRVKQGQFEGALLSELSMAEGQTLYQEISSADDARSLRLLEAFLDRSFGAAWRGEEEANARQESSEQQRSQSRTRSGSMTREEALDLLGLKDGASKDEIKDAYHRIMKQVHPDAGGSAYMAAKVNEAKALLLKS